MTEEPLTPIVAEISIEAPIEHVWDILTVEANVAEWLGCLNYKREVGSTFHMQPDPAKRSRGDVSGATHCTVVTLQSPHNFDFTWYVPGTPETLVQISLLSENGGRRTFVRLVHSGWENFPADAIRGFHEQLASGWSGSVLPSLKRAAERGAATKC